ANASRAPAAGVARSGQALSVAAAAVLAVQVLVSGYAREQQPGIEGTHLKMADDLARVAQDPAGPVPTDCFPGMDICVLPPERREDLVGILRECRRQLCADHYLRRHPAQRAAAERARGR